MKRKHLKIIIVSGLVLAFICILFIIAQDSSLADAGSFRGNSSFSSRSSRSSSSRGSSSSGDGFGFIIGWFLGMAFRHPIIFIIIVAVFILFNIFGKKKRGASSFAKPSVQLQNYMDIDLSYLMSKDARFSLPQLKTRLSRVYIEMQRAWTAKDFEPMRAYLTAQLFSEMEGQLKALRRDGLTNYVERTAVLDINAVNYREDETNDIITLVLQARNVDYTVVDQTGEVVVGSKRDEVFMVYEVEMIRSKGVLTPELGAELKAQSCPNCGAPIDMNSSGRCEYCNAILEAKVYDWVISNIVAIEQI